MAGYREIWSQAKIEGSRHCTYKVKHMYEYREEFRMVWWCEVSNGRVCIVTLLFNLVMDSCEGGKGKLSGWGAVRRE